MCRYFTYKTSFFAERFWESLAGRYNYQYSSIRVAKHATSSCFSKNIKGGIDRYKSELRSHLSPTSKQNNHILGIFPHHKQPGGRYAADKAHPKKHIPIVLIMLHVCKGTTWESCRIQKVLRPLARSITTRQGTSTLIQELCQRFGIMLHYWLVSQYFLVRIMDHVGYLTSKSLNFHGFSVCFHLTRVTFGGFVSTSKLKNPSPKWRQPFASHESIDSWIHDASEPKTEVKRQVPCGRCGPWQLQLEFFSGRLESWSYNYNPTALTGRGTHLVLKVKLLVSYI